MTSFAWALLAGTLAFATTGEGQTASIDASALELRVPNVTTAGELNDSQLLAESLAAGGGFDESGSQKLALRFENFLARLGAIDLPHEARPRAAAIFSRMHAELLTGKYHATCSDVGITLERGEFNCLTGTILFVCAARRCGLDAHAQAAEGHVLCRIHAGGGDFNVETTCPRWFELTDTEAAGAIERAASPMADKHGRRDFRMLTDAQLIAKIHYNRGVASLRAGQFEEGLRLTRASLALDPHDEVARGNVLAGLNNWALTLCEQAEYARAAELLDELRQLDPAYPTLKENQAHLDRARAKQLSEVQ